MKRSLGFAAAWVGATVVAVVVAAAAVGSVRSGVTDEPTALGSPSAASIASEVPAGAQPGAGTPSTSNGGAGAAPNEVTSTTLGTTTTTLSLTDTTTTTAATTQTTTTSSTTTTRASSYTKTIDTAGGSVTIVVDGSSVSFGGAVPKTGWKVELEKSGPEEVKVKFETNDDSSEIEVRARVEDGELRISISEDDD